MKKHLLAVIFLFWGSSSWAFEGIYLGGQAGYVGLSGATATTYDSSLGMGLDIGLRTSPVLDVLLQSQYSSHGFSAVSTLPSLKTFSQTVGANLHFEVTDFDLTLGGGPGFYFFSGALSKTSFGIHLGAGADVIVDENIRLGIGWRYHAILGTGNGDNYWSMMMRFGYYFPLGN